MGLFVTWGLLSYVLTFLVPSWTDKAPLSPKDMKSAIRVDVVDLPDYTLEQMEKLKDIDLSQPVGKMVESKPEVVEEEKPEEVTPPKAEKKVVALPKEAEKSKEDRKKKLEELRKKMRSESRRREIQEKLKEEVGEGRPRLAGNIQSEGYSLTGDVAKDIDAFTGKVYSHVMSNWRVPGWVQASRFSAQVLIYVAPDGRIIKQEFLKRSGNASYDKEVEQAIQDSSPLPQPPPSLRRQVMEEGIVCAFGKSS